MVFGRILIQKQLFTEIVQVKLVYNGNCLVKISDTFIVLSFERENYELKRLSFLRHHIWLIANLQI